MSHVTIDFRSRDRNPDVGDFSASRRSNLAARHGLVPCRRPLGRDQRQADQGSDVHAGRRAGEGRSKRGLSGRADVCAIFPARQRTWRVSASDVAWRRADRRHLGNDARWPRGLAELFPAQGLERLQFRCGRTRSSRLGAISRYLQERAGVSDHRQSVRTLSHRRWAELLRSGPRETQDDAGQPVSGRRLRQLRQAGRAALDHQRRRDDRGLYRRSRSRRPLHHHGA